MKQISILITGGAGFIGSHLSERLLSAGHKVSAFDNFNDFYDVSIKEENVKSVSQHPKADQYRLIRGDIRNQKAVMEAFATAQPDCVIHLAAMAGVRPSLERPLYYSDVNITGTQVLLQAVAESNIKRFVFASSSSVYGNNKKIPFSENDCVDYPISPYACTKKAGELLCHTYFHLYRISICCLRFFTVYGPRQRPDLAIHKFTKLMDEGIEIPLYGEGDTSRDYTYVDDCTDGVMRCLDWLMGQEGPKFEIFNLGESRMITLKQMVETIQAELSRTAKIRFLPAQPGDVVCTCADISKARDMLGYRPETDFEIGIRKFVEWYQAKKGAAVS